MFPVMYESPLVKGYMQAMQARGMRAQAKTEEEKLKSLPELLQAQLLAEQERARGMGITNEYLPQTLQSEIGLRNAQIPLFGAETARYNMMTRLAPQDQAIAQQNADTAQGRLAQSQNRFDNVYKVQQFIKTPAGQDFMSKNPQFAESVVRMIAGTGSLADDQVVGSLLGAPPTNIPQGVPQARLQADLKLGITPEQVKSAQEATRSDLIKKTVPMKQQMARIYSQSVDDMFKGSKPMLEDAVKYIGMQGAGRKFFEQAKGALGVPQSQEYKNFITYTKTYAPMMANELRLSMGGQATDFESKLLDSITNPNTLLTTPEVYRQQIEYLEKIRDSNRRAIAASGAQTEEGINAVLQREAEKRAVQQKGLASNGKRYTAEQLQAIAARGN